MKNHLPYLPFSEYRFDYQAIDSIQFPPFPGRLLHGAFGNALKESVCVFPNQGHKDTYCKDCDIKDQCSYTTLFKRHYLSEGNIGLKKTHSSPFIFKFDNQCFQKYPKRHVFSIQLLLVGQAFQKIDHIIRAMQLLGEHGISGNQAELIRIEQERIEGLNIAIESPEDHQAIYQPKTPSVPDLLTIHFMTPYNMRDDEMKRPFDISYWFMRLIRRLSRLQYTYGKQAINVDFKKLKALCEKIEINSSSLYFYETPQTRKTHTSGILGTIVISMRGVEELWPWLYLGQWFHNGKKTSNGNGRYRISICN